MNINGPLIVKVSNKFHQKLPYGIARVIDIKIANNPLMLLRYLNRLAKTFSKYDWYEETLPVGFDPDMLYEYVFERDYFWYEFLVKFLYLMSLFLFNSDSR